MEPLRRTISAKGLVHAIIWRLLLEVECYDTLTVKLETDAFIKSDGNSVICANTRISFIISIRFMDHTKQLLHNGTGLKSLVNQKAADPYATTYPLILPKDLTISTFIITVIGAKEPCRRLPVTFFNCFKAFYLKGSTMI